MTWWTLIPQTLILLFVCSTMQPFSEMAAGSSANTGSSLQLKHHCKNCLAWSVMLYCAITNLTILENAGTENASSVFQCLLLGLSFRKYSRSGNENRLPHNQSCSMGHGCESRFGPGRRRGLICCLFFFSCQCKILTEIAVGTTEVVWQQRDQCYRSTWAAELDWRGGRGGWKEFTFPVFAFTTS